jgi:hypothetical protein
MLVCCIVRDATHQHYLLTMYLTMQHTNIVFLQCTSRCNTTNYLLTMYLMMQHTIIIFLQCTSRWNTPTLSSYNVPHDAISVDCKKIMLVCCIVRYIVRRYYWLLHREVHTHQHYLLTMYLTMQHTIIIFLQCTSLCNTPTLSSYNVPHDATHHHFLLTIYLTMQHTNIIFLQCTSRCNTPTLSSLVYCIVRYIVRR